MIAPGSAHRGKDAMTPTRPTARSGSYYPFILLLLSLGCLVWAFWPTLTDLFNVWSSDPQYSHGFLVPVFAAFLLWMRRAMLKQGDVRLSWWDSAAMVDKPKNLPALRTAPWPDSQRNAAELVGPAGAGVRHRPASLRRLLRLRESGTTMRWRLMPCIAGTVDHGRAVARRAWRLGLCRKPSHFYCS